MGFHGSIMAAAVVAFKQRRDDEYKKEQAGKREKRIKEETRKIMDKYTTEAFLNKEQLRSCLDDVTIDELVSMDLLLDSDTDLAKGIAQEVGLEREGVEKASGPDEEDLPKFRGVPNRVSDAALEYMLRVADNGGDLAKIQYGKCTS